MVVKPLDVFVRDRVRPLLKEKGFSRSHHTFRSVAPNGDLAVIELRGWRLMQYELEFFTEVGLAPSTSIEWSEARFGRRAYRNCLEAIWWKRLRSPFVKPDSVTPTTDHWQFNPDDDDRIAVFLSELASAADHLKVLMDRQSLISVVRGPATKELRYSRDVSLALLLVDEGESPELEAALRALENKNPDDDVASWVRARLAAS